MRAGVALRWALLITTAYFLQLFLSSFRPAGVAISRRSRIWRRH